MYILVLMINLTFMSLYLHFILPLKVVMWINQNFLLQEDISAAGSTLDVTFLSLRGTGPLVLKMEQGGQVGVCLFLDTANTT